MTNKVVGFHLPTSTIVGPFESSNEALTWLAGPDGPLDSDSMEWEITEMVKP